MVSIVIVSHSAKLAEGVAELVTQMTQGQVPVAAAGGVNDPENPIGTDPILVREAIESVYGDDGVLVLMDLGSALLSAEMAVEFLSEKQRPNIRLCAAPLIEGAVAAAVQAMATSSLDDIAAEARNALGPKVSQLGEEISATAPPSTAQIPPEQERVLNINNYYGLHARPAAQFVGTAARFQAQIFVRNVTTGVGPVNAKSINQITTLGARQGHSIGLTASGPDADDALAALETLVTANFGESETAPEIPLKTRPPVQPTAAGQLAGIPVSPGIAIGPVYVMQLAEIEVETHQVDDPKAELNRLNSALDQAKTEIQALYGQALKQVGRYEAAIFEAHRLFLDDPALIDTARQRIQADRLNAGAAWQQAISQTITVYRNLDDAYLRARAADVADVGRRVLKLLTGAAPKVLQLNEPSILVATDLSPSDTAQLDPKMVVGICTELGSATSHSAILARALGIPAVVGLGAGISSLGSGDVVALNGEQGRVWIDPEPEKLTQLQAQRAAWLADQQTARAASQQPAQTRDGQRVEVVANIGGLNDVLVALESGAEGVGLFRTEFLFLDRVTPPTEAEQVAVYRQIGDALGQKPLIIRTLDIGGDKPLPYVEAPAEENPFLGWRGIRMMLDQTDVFKSQLRAILQASPGHNFKIMFPMISNLDEVRAAKTLLAEAQSELRAKGISFDETIEVGIMIEVPAAAAVADQLAPEVDFFSIGTNDLSQYTMAADRTNPKVAVLSTAFQPAVLRLIKQVIEAGHAAGIWVGLCGEFAGNGLAVPILLGLGLDEFSMSAPLIPPVKQTIAGLSVPQTQSIATAVLQLTSAQAVQEYVQKQLKS